MTARLDESLEAFRVRERDTLAKALVDSGLADLAASFVIRSEESERELHDLASTTLAWAERELGLRPMGRAGVALPNAVPVAMLDRFQLPLDWTPPEAGVLTLRVLAPEWRLRGATVRKALVEPLDLAAPNAVEEQQ